MAIVIGDIHGDAALAQAFLAYRLEEVHVALGDLVDNRKKVDLQEEMDCRSPVAVIRAIDLGQP